MRGGVLVPAIERDWAMRTGLFGHGMAVAAGQRSVAQVAWTPGDCLEVARPDPALSPRLRSSGLGRSRANAAGMPSLGALLALEVASPRYAMMDLFWSEPKANGEGAFRTIAE